MCSRSSSPAAGRRRPGHTLGVWRQERHHALEDVDLFNILSLPAAPLLPTNAMQTLYMTASSYCERRRAFLIVDIPPDVDSLTAMQTWMGANDKLRHRNAAVYFPRTRISDPIDDGRPRNIGASGTIAGLYARTDAGRGVWKAPAGTDARLRNVLELDYKLTDPQNGALNPLGVNCLRSFPVYSNICWGARTLDGADAMASEWHIPVRRLTLFEESLYRGTAVVFEPDEPLWAQIRLNVAPSCTRSSARVPSRGRPRATPISSNATARRRRRTTSTTGSSTSSWASRRSSRPSS